jgi:hypothetical protein
MVTVDPVRLHADCAASFALHGHKENTQKPSSNGRYLHTVLLFFFNKNNTQHLDGDGGVCVRALMHASCTL